MNEAQLREHFNIPSDALIGWHLCNADATLGYGDGRQIVEGEILTVAGRPPKLCNFGLHASPTPRLAYRNCRSFDRMALVWVREQIARDEQKFCGLERHTLRLLNVEQTTRVWQEWALWCAASALEAERLVGREPDPRSWAALSAVRAYLDGAITIQEMEITADAADAAAADAYADADAADADAARAAAYAAADAARAAADAAQEMELERLFLEAMNIAESENEQCSE